MTERKGRSPSLKKKDVRKAQWWPQELPRKQGEVLGTMSLFSQKRPGESLTGAVSFQWNSPPHRIPRSETPREEAEQRHDYIIEQKSHLLFLKGRMRLGAPPTPPPDLLGVLPSQYKDQD